MELPNYTIYTCKNQLQELKEVADKYPDRGDYQKPKHETYKETKAQPETVTVSKMRAFLDIVV